MTVLPVPLLPLLDPHPAQRQALRLERNARAIAEDGQQGGSWCGTALDDMSAVSGGTVFSEDLEGMKGIPNLSGLGRDFCPART